MDDIIVLKVGNYIECTITGVDDDTVYYKVGSNSNSLGLSKVSRLIYGDGRNVEVGPAEPESFQTTTVNKTTTVAPASSSSSSSSSAVSSSKTYSRRFVAKPGMSYSQYKDHYDSWSWSASYKDTFDPAVAALTSLALPGAGMYYCEEYKMGAVYTSLYAVSAILSGVAISQIVTSPPSSAAYRNWSIVNIVALTVAVSIDITAMTDSIVIAKKKNLYYRDLIND